MKTYLDVSYLFAIIQTYVAMQQTKFWEVAIY